LTMRVSGSAFMSQWVNDCSSFFGASPPSDVLIGFDLGGMLELERRRTMLGR
jgi:hypothetical protein